MRLALLFTLVASTYAAEFHGIPWTNVDLNRDTLLSRNVSTKEGRRAVLAMPGDWVLPFVFANKTNVTDFQLVNLAGKQAKFTVVFLDTEGKDLGLPFTGEGRLRGFEIRLAPYELFRKSTSFSDERIEGWAVVIPENVEDVIGGSAIVRAKLDEGEEHTVIPLSTVVNRRAILPYDNAGVSSEVYLSNSSTDPLKVKINARGANGDSLARLEVTIPPVTRLYAVVAEAHPETKDLRGTLEFEASAVGMSVLGMRSSGDWYPGVVLPLTHPDWK